MSDSFYPKLVGVPVNISMNPYVETQRHREGYQVRMQRDMGIIPAVTTVLAQTISCHQEGLTELHVPMTIARCNLAVAFLLRDRP